jgi:exonuclease 3'-5' domain-containing protein 2
MEIREDPKQALTASAALFLGAALLVLADIRIRRRKIGEDADGDDGESSHSDVPSHLQRLLYKEERRKVSTRHLAMKKPMYDNVEMYSPDCTLLCTISNKKAAWYINKNLGKWKEEHKALLLLFEPKAQPTMDNTYNATHKRNICVVCGESENFMRHYIVPYCYRQLFPIKYKTHMPHDIVILCPICHLQCEQQTQRRQQELDDSLRKDPRTKPPRIPDNALHKVKSAALALHKRRARIPHDKVRQYEQLIKQHFEIDELSNEMLEEAAQIETSTENPLYLSSPDLVVRSIANDPASIERFVIEWRDFFVDTMQPRFLPVGWNTTSPVHI